MRPLLSFSTTPIFLDFFVCNICSASDPPRTAWKPGDRPARALGLGAHARARGPSTRTSSRAYALGLGPCARARTSNPGGKPRMRARPRTLRARARTSNPGGKPRRRAQPRTLRARAAPRPGRQAARTPLDLDPARARGPSTRASSRACALSLGPSACARPLDPVVKPRVRPWTWTLRARACARPRTSRARARRRVWSIECPRHARLQGAGLKQRRARRY